MKDMHYYFIWNDTMDEQGVVIMPYNSIEALDSFLSTGLTGILGNIPVKIKEVDLLTKPNEVTSFLGTFIEKRNEDEIVWSVKYVGSMSKDERFGLILT